MIKAQINMGKPKKEKKNKTKNNIGCLSSSIE